MMVNVIGLGYIGLPTALMLASHGVDVVGTDYNRNLVSTLQAGEVTFEEDGLDELMSRAIEGGIRFSSSYQKTGFYIVSVPTPYVAETKKVDASYVVSAVESVLDVCEPGSTIVIESTISPGTIDDAVRPVIASRGLVCGKDVNLVHAPERIIPGNMIAELVHNNRTIGADDPAVAEAVKAVYASFCEGDIVLTDIRTAEMTKVVENTFRDVNIAFANELAKICHMGHMDVREVIRIANMHPRVNILQPGPGVGGHCISVDPWFLVGDYPSLTKVISSAREVNDSMPEYVLDRAREVMDECGISDVRKVGIYGLTYKADVDDVRESPTLQMLDSMRRHLAADCCKVYDPMVQDDVVSQQVHSLEEFLAGIEMVVLMIGHEEVRSNPSIFGDCVVLDTRNALPDGEKVFRL
ncbi:nucleotide sugar dehydrogenase [uncultured Adlercreutzia sp.]|uniref:nucleotide sugar dehydrogenase n=1 Tax=uncultured Adlercreutzia sp. TaxID=875803 RepID=UPI0026F40031|nr:nucleotide sugar dehydrogenase [uncultured Adlercreutzia sp.]